VVTNERLDAAAIVTTLLAPVTVAVIAVLVFTLHWPAGLGTGLFYSFVAVPVGLLAIYKSRTGGAITLLMGGLLLTASLMTNHYPQYYVPTGGLSIAGGLLHLFRPRW